MAVSKRTRFEVLRRDNYTCRYCKSTENPLTIDHVTPVALGGSDDPSNLVAACRDCNSGKSSSNPDAATVAQVSDDAVRWADARRQAAQMFEQERKDRWDRAQPFLESWQEWDSDASYLPVDWDETVDRWLDSGLTHARLQDALTIALGARHVAHRSVFTYICGIVRNWLKEIDERAQTIVRADDEPVETEAVNAEVILVDFIDRAKLPRLRGLTQLLYWDPEATG